MRSFEFGGASYPQQYDLIDHGPLTYDQFSQGYAATQNMCTAGDTTLGADARELLDGMRETHPDLYGQCVVEQGDSANNIAAYY